MPKVALTARRARLREDEESEALAAKASPVKGGVRSTSSALVRAGSIKTVESLSITSNKTSLSSGSHAEPIQIDDNDDGQSVVTNTTGKGRSAPKNADLPASAHNRSKWGLQFIPTLLRILGTHDDPWNLPDKTMVQLLQRVWDAVYRDQLSYTVRVNDAVHALSAQRIYEWWSAFGHAAFRVFESSFEARSERFRDSEACRKFCCHILANCRLFYENPEEDVKRVSAVVL
ncbi:hypothetical protein NUW54_g14368 [Trametes sanguinea]|uniref:Uncharacterized protein n=1 Tax=Trametes sanguinea TaxID=158606 RepID=A0ACC1MDC0_9APHY|nr:hypothetical protein NUW54_g14368 [Trametes sanguinea]